MNFFFLISRKLPQFFTHREEVVMDIIPIHKYLPSEVLSTVVEFLSTCFIPGIILNVLNTLFHFILKIALCRIYFQLIEKETEAYRKSELTVM